MDSPGHFKIKILSYKDKNHNHLNPCLLLSYFLHQGVPLKRGRIGLVISDIWAKTPNDDDILSKNLLISDT